MRIIVCSLLFAALPGQASAQTTFDFNSGDLSQWQGTPHAFTITEGMLRSNHSVTNSTFYLSTPMISEGALEWEFDARMDFATSSTNYADVFLLSTAPDLSAGYFIRIGNSADDVSLYRQSTATTAQQLINGRDATTGEPLHIRVTRSASGEWRLFTNNIQEGSATDNTFTIGSYFGIAIRQSTASFFNRHYFDNIVIRPLVEDLAPPSIISATALSAKEILLRFSEPVISAEFSIATTDISWLGNEAKLLLAAGLGNGITTEIIANNIRDLNGNITATQTFSVSYYTAGQYDILIHEILADPSPSAGLPEYEFVELRNVSAHPVNLQGWRLHNNSTSITLPAYTLQPDSLVMLCDKNAGFHPSMDLNSFMALANDGETISLYNNEGKLIHAVTYSNAWYTGSIKDAGGWSLEMMDIQWPCAGAANWKASINPNGGTPGRTNSVTTQIPPPPVPELLRISVPDSNRLQLHFSGTIDSASAATPSAYNISGIDHIYININTVILQLAGTITSGTLIIQNITDCNNRPVLQHAPMPYALPQQPDSLDLVINEILFDPPTGAADFVEIYNRSSKAIELNKLYFASRDVDGSLKQSVLLCSTPFLCMPGDYIAFTTELNLCRYFICGNVQRISSLPTLPPDEGNITLLRADNRIIDQFSYNKAMHLPTLQQPKGISLERLHPDDPQNWHSAAGNGTPGAPNTQFRPISPATGFLLETSTFSPDNDGYNDVAILSWGLDPGQSANITIFDAKGHTIRHLARNLPLGNHGRLVWDGISDNGIRAIHGIYVIFVEIFTAKGKIRAWKLPLVLAETR